MESTGTFGKNTKGAATMGSKHRVVKNSNPGPGQYEGKAVRPSSNYGKIGSTKRQDLWGADKTSKEAAPGPGHHGEHYSSFANTKGGASNFGSSRKDKKNSNPGPGQYNASDRIKSANHSSVRIGTTKRPDLW